MIGILTPHYNYKNFGCILQAYSTLRYLKSLGYQVEIIDHRYPGKLAAIGAIATKGQLEMQRFIETLPLSQSFVDQDIAKTEEYIKQRYKLVIYGSDEIWKWHVEPNGSQPIVSYNVPIPNLYWPVGLKVPHIAYAPTIGASHSHIPGNIAAHLARSLKEFDRIGARDIRTANLVKKLSGIDADIVPDPAYLNDLSAECDPDRIKYKLQKAGADFSKPVTGIYSPARINVNELPGNVSAVNLNRAELSPIEFWYAPKLLAAMITNSHHGVIVSVIHNTPCIVTPQHPPKVSDHVNRYQLPVGVPVMEAIKQWDHQHIHTIVETERATTRDWLRGQCQKLVPEPASIKH